MISWMIMDQVVSNYLFQVNIEDGLDDEKRGIPKIIDSEDTFEDGNFKNRLV